MEGGPSAWAPAPAWEDQEEAPGSWLRIGAALAVAAIWGMKQQKEDLSLCLFLSLSVTLPFK